MADVFERMLIDLQREHNRQLAKLNAEIDRLRREVVQCRAEEACAASNAEPTLVKQNTKVSISSNTKVSMSSSVVNLHPKSLPADTRVSEVTQESISSSAGHSVATRKTAFNYVVRDDPATQWSKVKPVRPSEAALQVGRRKFTTHRFSTTLTLQIAQAQGFSSFRGVIESSGFEAASAIIILAYTLCNILSLQFSGMKRGYSLEIAGYGNRDDLWGAGVAVLNVVDLALNVVFALEFLFRVMVLCCDIFWSVWNWLDFILLVAAVVDVALGGVHGNKNGSSLRLLRIFRVLRVLKALKVGGSLSDVLHVLMASVRASVNTLCWALVMIIPLQIVCALIIIPVLEYFYDRGDVSIERKQEVFFYFGTFSRSLLTFFEILFGNYATPCRVLIDNVGEEYGAMITVYRCICGFSVLCVVQAVFIQQTMKIMSQDSEVMLREKAQFEKTFMKHLEQLFWSLDLEGDGHISREEFAETLHHDDVRMYCHALGLDPHDLVDIFNLVDEGDGVYIRDFIQAARQIRKQAKTIDIARVLANVEKTKKIIEKVPDLVVHRLSVQSLSIAQNQVRAGTDAPSVTDTKLRTAAVALMPDGFSPCKQEL